MGKGYKARERPACTYQIFWIIFILFGEVYFYLIIIILTLVKAIIFDLPFFSYYCVNLNYSVFNPDLSTCPWLQEGSCGLFCLSLCRCFCEEPLGLRAHLVGVFPRWLPSVWSYSRVGGSGYTLPRLFPTQLLIQKRKKWRSMLIRCCFVRSASNLLGVTSYL